MHRCGLLLQMLQSRVVCVCLSLCLCVLGTRMSWANMAELIEMPFGGGRQTHKPKKIYIREGSEPPWEGHLWGDMCWTIVTYRSAFYTFLLPQANMPAHRMRWANALAAARGDKMALQPFVKLLWTFVIISINSAGKFQETHLRSCSKMLATQA